MNLLLIIGLWHQNSNNVFFCQGENGFQASKVLGGCQGNVFSPYVIHCQVFFTGLHECPHLLQVPRRSNSWVAARNRPSKFPPSPEMIIFREASGNGTTYFTLLKVSSAADPYGWLQKNLNLFSWSVKVK